MNEENDFGFAVDDAQDLSIASPKPAQWRQPSGHSPCRCLLFGGRKMVASGGIHRACSLGWSADSYQDGATDRFAHQSKAEKKWSRCRIEQVARFLSTN
jgi:hypothetical protein